MIRTKIVEVIFEAADRVKEIDRGYCQFPEVPVEKKQPEPGAKPETLPVPMRIQFLGENYFLLGHTWSIEKLVEDPSLELLPAPTMILIIQKIPVASSIIPAGANELTKIERQHPMRAN